MPGRLFLEVEPRSVSAHSAITSLLVLNCPTIRIREIIEQAAPLIRPRRVLQYHNSMVGKHVVMCGYH